MPAHRELLVLEIGTRGGLTGMAYLHPLAGGLETLNACMKELIAPKVLGRGATEIEGILDRNDDLWVEPAIPVDARSSRRSALVTGSPLGRRSWRTTRSAG